MNYNIKLLDNCMYLHKFEKKRIIYTSVKTCYNYYCVFANLLI